MGLLASPWLAALLASPWLAVLALASPWLASFVWQNFVWVAWRRWCTRRIPEPSCHALSPVGHLAQLIKDPGQSFRVFYAWAKELGPIYRVRFLDRPVVVVTSPELYQPLLRSGPRHLPKYTPPYRMFEVFVRPHRSNVLSSPENATWKAVRRAAVNSLTMANLRLAFPAVCAVTQRLIDGLAAAGPGAVHDMDAAAARVTVDVIGVAGFARDLCATAPGGDLPAGQRTGVCGCAPLPKGDEVLATLGQLVKAMQARNNPLNRWLPWRQAYKDLRTYGTRMSNLVQALYADMVADPPPPHTLGRALMECSYPDGTRLDEVQVMCEIGLFWGAGFETTARSLAWALLCVATHPEVEQRLCAELAGLGLLASPAQPKPAPLRWEHLGQLKYLSAVISESMRLFPAVSSGTIRVTDKPLVLAGHRLPAGQPILIPFFSIHRSAALWDEPESFRPSRWLAEAAAAPPPEGEQPGLSTVSSDDGEYVHVNTTADDVGAARDQDQQQPKRGAAGSKGPPLRPAASTGSGLELKDPEEARRGFLPFSEGSRNCVGQALALVEMKAVMALLLGNFSFALTPEMGGFAGVEATARQTVTMRPEHGLLMTARHRGTPA